MTAEEPQAEAQKEEESFNIISNCMMGAIFVPLWLCAIPIIRLNHSW
jgi:hypothetical protein